MKLLYSLSLILMVFACSGQYYISSDFLGTTSTGSLSIIPGITPNYSVDYYKIVYNTTDASGAPTIASGGFGIPNNAPCDTFALGLYCHGTSLNKDEVPSRNNYEAIVGKLFASKGFIMCCPDYLGMGDSPGLHPYVHGETEATASIDMLRAVREYLSDSMGIQDNGEVFITGYSQGGHAAMATHKYIEENGLLSEFNVVASAPASGPYDMSGSQSELLLSNDPYSNPGYVVYLLASYQEVYGNLYNTYADVLKFPYDTIVPPFFDGNNYSLDMGDLNPLLPNQLEDLIEDTVLQNFNADSNHALWIALRDNDNYNWVPQRPVRMYYCTLDEQVDYTNALEADSYMNANGAPNVSSSNIGPSNHSDCAIPALLGAFYWAADYISSCAFVGVEEAEESLEIKVYPNPASIDVTVDATHAVEFYRISDLQGKLLKSESVQSTQFTITTSDLSSGIYLLTLIDDSGKAAIVKLSVN